MKRREKAISLWLFSEPNDDIMTKTSTNTFSRRRTGMNKIICDICGSTYPETASCCPICGSSREFGVENPDYIPAKMPEYVPESKKKQGLFSSGAKKAQDYLYEIDEPEFDTMNDVLPEAVSNEDASCAPQKRSNYFVVVLLTSIIGICLLICGFLFFRYYIQKIWIKW